MIEVYDLRRLPEHGETLDEALEKSWLQAQLGDDPDVELVPLGDGHARITIAPLGTSESAHGPVIRVSAELRARVSTPCVRCLSDVELAIHSLPDVTLFPAPPAPKEDEGDERRGSPRRGKSKKDEDEDDAVALDPSEADATTYTHHQIDLPALVREALLLEIPMNPACADEAACAGRTSTLIASVTPPDQSSVDPRWAALEALKAKLS